MAERLKLMAVFAHPDDESLGVGGTLLKYASEGVEVTLVTATRGERGWWGAEEDYPGLEALGATREGELRCAIQELGVSELVLLDYIDGDLDQADPTRIIGQIVAQIRRVRPQVVITFDPFGVYGHPDHIAICQFATAAVTCAADPEYACEGDRSCHGVSKLYYMATTAPELAVYQEVFGELVMEIDGVERRAFGWPAWALTTTVDTSEYGEEVMRAIACHQSQLSGYQPLQDMDRAKQRDMWCTGTFYRAFSHVNGGREPETDLFAGLRD